VDIGNVSKIRVVPYKDKQLTPVEVVMKVSTKYSFNLHRDSVASLSTAGVLGENLHRHRQLPRPIGPGGAKTAIPYRRRCILTSIRFVRSSQEHPSEHGRPASSAADRILAFAESGKGSLGKLIYDPTLYDRFSATVKRVQGELWIKSAKARAAWANWFRGTTLTTKSCPFSTS